MTSLISHRTGRRLSNLQPMRRSCLLILISRMKTKKNTLRRKARSPIRNISSLTNNHQIIREQKRHAFNSIRRLPSTRSSLLLGRTLQTRARNILSTPNYVLKRINNSPRPHRKLSFSSMLANLRRCFSSRIVNNNTTRRNHRIRNDSITIAKPANRLHT